MENGPLLLKKNRAQGPVFQSDAVFAAALLYLPRAANRVQVLTTVSGLSDIESMP